MIDSSTIKQTFEIQIDCNEKTNKYKAECIQLKIINHKIPIDIPEIDYTIEIAEFQQLSSINERKDKLNKIIEELPQLTDEIEFIKKMILINKLLPLQECIYDINCRSFKQNIMNQILNKFSIIFTRNKLEELLKVDQAEEKSIQLYICGLFTLLNNPDSFESNEKMDQYQQLKSYFFILYDMTLGNDNLLSQDTFRLILATMSNFIDILPYEELDKDKDNNINNPVNNISKNLSLHLIDYLPQIGTFIKKDRNSDQNQHLFQYDNFIIDIYDKESGDLNLSFPITLDIKTIQVNPQKIINDHAKFNVKYVAIYAYPYYPKISYNTTEYSKSFIGFKLYDEMKKEIQSKHISPEARPVLIINNQKTLSRNKYCYFFNGEEFNPFSNLGIKHEHDDANEYLLCNISMIKDYTFGERQIMRVTWIGVLGVIALLLIIALFIFFFYFVNKAEDNKENNRK